MMALEQKIVKMSVYGILLNLNNDFLLQKRANTNYANGWWSLPGGHVEANESILAAVQRELSEELGIKVHSNLCSFRLTLVRKPQQDKRYINFFFVIKNWIGFPTISDEKASDLNFFSYYTLPDPTLPYIKEALELIENGIQFYESLY